MSAWNLTLPSGDDSLLLWSQTVCIWAVALYANQDPTSFDEVTRIYRSSVHKRRWILALTVRNTLAASLVLVMSVPGQQLGALGLSIFVLLSLLLIPLVRNRLVQSTIGRRWLVEWEICGLVAANLGVALVIGHWQLGLTLPLFILPLSAGGIARMSLMIAAYVMAMKLGTFAVRGMITRVEALPARNTELLPHLTTELEMNRGRLIGNLERVLIVTLVIMGRFEALGFLVAAKGLIRIKKFEEQDFAEYFLVGTLTSVIVAVAVGLAYVKCLKLLPLAMLE